MSVSAQTYNPKTRILFLLDCSGSMSTKMGDVTRMTIAKRMLTHLVDSLSAYPEISLAFRSYGFHSPKYKQDCRDTRLEVGFGRANAKAITDVIAKFQPNGTTPIAYSLTQCATDFPDRTSRNIIILVTDGLEECGGDPCAVSAALQARGVVLKPFIIGLGIDDDFASKFTCVGRYFNAKTESELKEIFGQVMSQACNTTTLEVDLLDINNKASETNVNMTFYDSKTNKIQYNYYHTLNSKNLPDTFQVDPIFVYNIQINTTPPVIKENVIVKASQHNIVKISTPQGLLQINSRLPTDADISVLVRQSSKQPVIFVHELNSNHKYLVGTYDLEILSLPKIIMKDVKVSQSQTTKIEIQQPGRLELNFIKEVVGSVYVLRNGKQEWVTDIGVGLGTISKESYYLQPYNYKIVYRPKGSVETTETTEKNFTITAGGALIINLD